MADEYKRTGQLKMSKRKSPSSRRITSGETIRAPAVRAENSNIVAERNEMSMVIKICGVILMVLVPMAFGLIVSRILSFVMGKLRKPEVSND